MQPSGGQLAGLAAAAATGATAAAAVWHPSAATYVTAGLAGGLWLATVVRNGRFSHIPPRPVVPGPLPVIDDDELRVVPVQGSADGHVVNCNIVGRIPLSSQHTNPGSNPGALAVRFASVLSSVPGSLSIGAQATADTVNFSCTGWVPDTADRDLKGFAADAGLSQDLSVAIKRRERTGPGHLLGIFSMPTSSVAFGPLRSLFRAIAESYQGTIADFNLDVSHTQAAFTAAGHAMVSFASDEASNKFAATLAAWRDRLRPFGWQLQPY